MKTEDPAGKLAKAAASARIKQDGGMTAGGKAGGSEAPGSAEEASRDFTAPSPNDPLTRPQQKGLQEDPSSAESMMQEATKLLKALQKLKALKLGRSSDVAESASCQGEVALLDGGATHALREATEAEKREPLIPITVELAHGSTTLYQKEGIRSLLTQSSP